MRELFILVVLYTSCGLVTFAAYSPSWSKHTAGVHSWVTWSTEADMNLSCRAPGLLFLKMYEPAQELCLFVEGLIPIHVQECT